jgi:DNA-directed RNA polymerase specialized sigma24 family protein
MPERYDSAQLRTLHRRLCNGDRTAPEEVARLLLPPLVQEISRQFSQTDEHVIWDGVSDAILDYCAQPDSFDEKRNVPLDRFLRIAAWRNVANAVRGEKRRKAREEKAVHAYGEPSVELESAVGNLLQQEKDEQHQTKLMNALQSETDQQILALRLQGERRTEAFAKILGISHMSVNDQRRAVKRAKDRIDKLLRRQLGGQS